MPRVNKRIEYNTRSINFTAIVSFASMGKWVTDWMIRFHEHGFVITNLPEIDPDEPQEIDAPAEHELQCVIAALDAKGIPTEIAPGQPYSVHGRVLAALDMVKGK